MHRSPAAVPRVLAWLLVCAIVTGNSSRPAAAANRARSASQVQRTLATLEPWQRELVREWMADHPGADPPATLVQGLAGPASVQVNDGAWSTNTPPIRYHHGGVYDSRRDRMIIFGGFGLSGTSGGIFNDVWTLSLSDPPTWRPLATAGTPPPARYSCSAIYDVTDDQVVVFGGEIVTGFPANDVWRLDLSQPTPTWTQVLPIGSRPTPRYDQSAVYDPLRNRLLIFGGLDSTGVNLNDTWVLTLSNTPVWVQLLRAGAPPERRSAAMIYDPTRDQIVVYGGFGVAPDLSDTWVLGLGTSSGWIPVFASNPPPGRHNHTAIYDPVRDRMVIFGGGTDTQTYNDAWALPLGGFQPWSKLTPGGVQPVARFGHAMIYDPTRDRIVVCAGRDTTGLASLGAILRGDTWALSFTANAWAPLPALTRSDHAMALDSFRDQLVVFGGNDGAGDRNDVWSLPLGTNGVWTPVPAQGTPPSPRQRAGMIYDVVRDQLLVFGGISGGTCFNQVWRLSRTGTQSWTLLGTTGTPPAPREGAGVWYDRARDRMVVVCGHQLNGGVDTWYNDAWTLSLATLAWQPLTATGTPPAGRAGHVLAYDSKRDRLLVQGGVDAAGTLRSDTWALTLGATPAWSALAPTGTPPALARTTGMYDPVRDRLVVFSGWGGSPAFYRADLKALSLAGTPAWTTLVPTSTALPRPRASAAGLYDPRRDRFMVFGGYGSYPSRLGTLDDTWALTWGTPAAAPPPSVSAFAFEPPAPNPARGMTRFAFTLTEAARVQVMVVDAAGRRVRTLADRAFPAGRSQLLWDGRTGAGAVAPPGMYFVRIDADGREVMRRVAMVH